MKYIIQIFFLYLILANLVSFFLMGIDKRKAIRQAYRIPESTLFLSALCGGSIGSLLGMSLFHHKTKKWKFRLGMPAVLLLHLTLLYLFYFPVHF